LNTRADLSNRLRVQAVCRRLSRDEVLLTPMLELPLADLTNPLAVLRHELTGRFLQITEDMNRSIAASREAIVSSRQTLTHAQEALRRHEQLLGGDPIPSALWPDRITSDANVAGRDRQLTPVQSDQ
jgi:hypothetical protein